VDAATPGVDADAPGVDAAVPGEDAEAPGLECAGDASTDACSDVTQPSDGDGCCPMGASSNDDSDCIPLCGNGMQEAGEGCDPGSAATACPIDCDDTEVCTSDVLSGADLNCDTLCSHDPITAAADGDGCCPEGAHNTNDADCAPRCGNGVVETGEESTNQVGTRSQDSSYPLYWSEQYGTCLVAQCPSECGL
jgi:hypothetical protein